MKIYKYSLGPMGTNCYLAVDPDSKKTAVIDPGGDFEKIKNAIESKGLSVCAIILTHAHFDHMMALEELRDYTKAPLLVHKDDCALLYDNEKNLMLRFAGVSERIREAEVLLEDNDTVSIGAESLRVMHTPGHTPGSICLICGDIMISGDTLFRESIGRYDFPGGDYETIMASVSSIAKLEVDYKIYPGHGPSTHLSHEKENNLYLQ